MSNPEDPVMIPGMIKIPITIDTLKEVLSKIGDSILEQTPHDGKQLSKWMIQFLEEIRTTCPETWAPLSIVAAIIILRELLDHFAIQLIIE